MAKKGVSDLFVQKITLEVDVGPIVAGQGQAVVRFPSAYSAKDHIGIVIQRAEYVFSPVEKMSDAFSGANTEMEWGLGYLAVSPNAWGFEPDSPGLLDYNRLESIYIATQAGWLNMIRTPYFKDFNGFIGGGLLVHPSNLYAWIGSYAGIAAGGASFDLFVTLFYHTVQLTPDMYTELWEARIMAQVI